MKKLFALLMLMPSLVFAGGSVQVDTNTFLVTWPTNFFNINGVVATGTVTALDTRVGVLETKAVAQSNTVTTATNDLQILTTNFNAKITNTATFAQGIIATNNAARISVLELSSSYTNQIPYTNGSIYVTGSLYSAGSAYVTGTVYAASFVGSGVGLTGVISAVTGGVNSVTAGGSNFTGNIVLNGTGFGYGGPGTITVTRVDYMCRNIALATNIYEQSLEGPRDEEMTIVKIFAKADAYQATFNLISYPTNSPWRANITTNIANIVAIDTGIIVTNNIVIPAGYEWGTQIVDFDPRSTQVRITYKVQFH